MDDEQVKQDLNGGDDGSPESASPPTSDDRSKDVAGLRAPGAPEQLERNAGTAASPANGRGISDPAKAGPAKNRGISDLEEATLKRIEAAEKRAAQAEAYARTVQAAKDRENEQLRKETRERLARERAATVALLKSTGVDPAQLDAFERQQTQADETDELRYKAAAYDNLSVQEQIKQQRDQYVRSRAELFGVDPGDPRLDVSSPEAFDRSLAAIVRGNEPKKPNEPMGQLANEPKKPNEPKGDDKSARGARQDLDVLTPGSGAGASSGENNQNPRKVDTRALYRKAALGIRANAKPRG